MELMTEEKKGVKRTEIGLIPEDWEVVQLGDIINYTKGFAFKSAEYSDSGIRIVRVSDVKKGEIKKDGGVFIPYAHSSKYSSWSLNADDIIVSTVGSKPPLYESIVGKPYLVKENESGYLLNQNAVKLRVNNDSKYSQDLLYHHFEVRRYYEHIEEIFRGNANQASITLESLFKYKIPLPPTLKEQQAIASALSDVDELIRSLDGLIQKKQAIKKGTMQQLLTGKKRLPGFDGEWVVKRLGDVCQIISGGTPSTRNSEYWDGDIKWCTPTDITSNKGKYLSKTSRKITDQGLKNSSATLLPKGTLLLCSRATVGEVRIAESEISTNQGFKSLICSESVDNEFLYYLVILRKQKFIDKAFGSTFLEISKKNTANIEFDFPSVEEQKAIARILSDMDRELQTLRQKREKYVQIKQGMMQELLTGRIRIYGMGG